jgi:hypothetical protein
MLSLLIYCDQGFVQLRAALLLRINLAHSCANLPAPQVHDAVEKLVALGIVKETIDPSSGAHCLTASSLDEALAAAQVGNVSTWPLPRTAVGSARQGLRDGHISEALGKGTVAADGVAEGLHPAIGGLYLSPVASAKQAAANRAAAAATVPRCGSGTPSSSNTGCQRGNEKHLLVLHAVAGWDSAQGGEGLAVQREGATLAKELAGYVTTQVGGF